MRHIPTLPLHSKGEMLIFELAVSLSNSPKTISLGWVPAERLALTSLGRASRTSTRLLGATRRCFGGISNELRPLMSCILWRIRRATG